MSDPPRLSVVIAASDSAEALGRTLSSLASRGVAETVEVIVAAARDRIPSLPPIAASWPIVWVTASPGAGVPRLRRLALEHARAPVVAFSEDSCEFGPGWCAAWIRAFLDPEVRAATGPVAPAMGDAPLDWAVFFCEYAPFLPRRTARKGPPGRLAGNNFAVRLQACIGRGESEVHESDFGPSALDRAGSLVMVEDALAAHVRRYALREAIGDRLRFGRAYGRLRARGQTLLRRLLVLVAGPAIFAAQVARLVALVASRRSHLGRFLECLAITLLLLLAWSVGEWIGWLGGPSAPPLVGRQHGKEGPPPAQPPGRARSRPRRCRPAPTRP